MGGSALFVTAGFAASLPKAVPVDFRNLAKLLQLRSTCVVKEQARPGEHAPEGGARESEAVALCRSWWAGKAPLGLSRWLAPSCPEQHKVKRTLGQSIQACAVGGCSLLCQPRFSKASSPGQVIRLFAT